MAADPVVVLVGTLDSKEHELKYMRDRVREAGAEVVLVDVGVLEVMGRGAGAVLGRLFEEGRLQGAAAVGGSGNSSIAAAAIRDLPVGVWAAREGRRLGALRRPRADGQAGRPDRGGGHRLRPPGAAALPVAERGGAPEARRRSRQRQAADHGRALRGARRRPDRRRDDSAGAAERSGRQRRYLGVEPIATEE